MGISLDALRHLMSGEDEATEQEEQVKKARPTAARMESIGSGGFSLDQIKQLSQRGPAQPEEPGLVSRTLSAIKPVADIVGKPIMRQASQAMRGISSAAEGVIVAKQVQNKIVSLWDEDPEQWVDDFQAKLAKQASEKFGYTHDINTAGELLSNPGAMVERSLDVAAQVGVLLGTGGTGLAALVASEAGNAREDAERRLLERGESEESAGLKATVEGALVGLASFALNKLTLGQGKNLGIGKQFTDKLKSNLAGQLLKQGSKVAAGAATAGSEALEEMVTGAVQDTAQWAVENDRAAFEGFWERRAIEGLTGVAGGGVAAGALGTIGQVAQTRQESVAKAAARVESLAKSPEGQEKLAQYAAKDQPTRADLADLGIKDRFSAADRAALAIAVDPDALASTKHFISQAAGKPEIDEQIQQRTDEVLEPTLIPGSTSDQPSADQVDQQSVDTKQIRQPPTQPQLVPPILSEESGTHYIGPLAFRFQHWLDIVTTPGMKKTGKAIKKATIGLDPLGRKIRDYRQAKAKEGQRISSRAVDIEKIALRMQKAIAKSQGIPITQGIPTNISLEVNDYLQGKNTGTALDPEVLASANEMRQAIDANSREILESGVITEAFNQINSSGHTLLTQYRDAIANNGWGRTEIVEDLVTNNQATEPEAHLAASLILNEGTYLNRAFEAFGNQDWSKQLDPQIRQNFYAWMQAENPAMTPNDIELATNNLLDAAAEKGNLTQLWQDGRFLKLHTNMLKRKLDLPQELVDLLGEKTNVVENFVRTSYNQIKMVEEYKAMEELRNTAMGTLFWTKDTRPNNEVVPLKPDGGPFSPLTGLYTTPEIREIIHELADKPWFKDKPVLEKYIQLESFIQKGKTALSTTAHARQLIGNPWMMLRNGHMNPVKQLRYMRQAWEIVKQDVRQESRFKGDTSKLQRAVELGILDSSVDVNSLNKLGKADTFEKLMSQLNFNKGPGSVIGKTAGQAKLAWDKSMDVYGAEDSLFKVASWLAEIDQYKKADPNLSSAELEEMAADIVLRTMPSWSSLPPVFQRIKHVPVMGPFMTFPISMWQSTWGTIHQIGTELQSPNPQIKAIGAKRIVGAMLAAGAAETVAKTIGSALGWTDDEVKDLQKLGPSWSRNSLLIPVSDKSADPIQYINWSYVDPHGNLKEAIRGILGGVEQGEIMKGFGDGMAEVFGGFFRDKMALDLYFQLTRNRTQWDKQIWLENDNDITKAAKASAHLVASMAPGVAKSAYDHIQDLRGFEPKTGKVGQTSLTVKDFGIKLETLTPEKQLLFSLLDLKQANSDINRIYQDLERGGEFATGEVDGLFQRAVINRDNALETVREKYNAAIKLTPKLIGELESLGQSARLRKEDYVSIMTNERNLPLPESIKALNRAIVEVTNHQLKEQLTDKRDAVVVSKLMQSVQSPGFDNDNARSIANAKSQLDLMGLTPTKKFDMWVAEQEKRSVNARVNVLQRKTKGQVSEEYLLQQAIPHVRALKERASWWTDSRKAQVARLGLTEGQLRQIGFTDKDIIDFYPSPGVPQ